MLRLKFTMGFRPLSGTVFPKLDDCESLDSENHVSVPSRGLYFLNIVEFIQKQERDVSVPSRGLYFLNCLIKNLCKHSYNCFRPLSGTVFPKYRPLRPWKTLSVFLNLRGKIFFRKYSFIFNKETS